MNIDIPIGKYLLESIYWKVDQILSQCEFLVREKRE